MSILDDQELFSKGLQLFKDNNLDNSLNYINKIKNKNLNTLKLLSQIYKKKNDVKNTKFILNNKWAVRIPPANQLQQSAHAQLVAYYIHQNNHYFDIIDTQMASKNSEVLVSI